MSLALVQAVTTILLTIVGTWTGLLVSVAFLLPRAAAKSEQLLADAPWKCFLRGLGMGALFLAGLMVQNIGNPLVKLMGLAFILFSGAIAGIGSSGIAQMIGKRGALDNTTPTFAMLLRGSLAYSLAIGFPVIGWFVFAPIVLCIAMGAGVTAIVPERRTAITPPTVPPAPNSFDLNGPAIS